MNLLFNLLWRDWKSGQLSLLLISLIIAISTITGIALFASRIENSILGEATQVLAGDAQISGSQPLPEDWLNRARADGLAVSEVTGFRAMAFSPTQTQLAAIKAVDDAYPLKGELLWAEQPYGASKVAAAGPRAGEVWLTSRLFAALETDIGKTVEIGNAEFVVAGALIQEPDNAESLFGVAPRVLMHRDDIDRTGAIQIGSRIRYTAMLAGNATAISRFQDWLEPQLGSHHRWVTVEESNQSIGQALTRARYFLYLAGSLGVLLAAVAIALAARRYAMQRIGQVALLKTLGTTPAQIRRIYTLQLVVLGVVGVVIGSFLGWLAHLGIVRLLDAFSTYLAAPTPDAYLIGIFTGFLCLLGFAAPPFFQLSRTLPAAVFRQTGHRLQGGRLSALMLGLTCTFVLIIFYSRSVSMTLYIAIGTAACVLLATVLASGFIHVLSRSSRWLGQSGRMGLANLQRHRHINTPQIALFAILFMLLFCLIILRTSLLQTWQQQLPADAPNHFVFNIFDDEREQVRQLLAGQNVTAQTFYPMVRGRLTAVNSDDLETRLETRQNDVNYERELYLTWADELAQDNEVIAGQWWANPSAEELLVSLEQTFAEGLEIQLGDQLHFSVSGEVVSAQVASIRTVQWDSMRPNFFVIFNRPLLEGDVANWITSFYLPDSQKEFVNQLARALPTLSIIEIDQTLNQVRSIIDRVSSAVEFIWLLVLGAGVLVLITSIQSTLDIRFQEGAILRTLGAPRRLIRNLLSVEFASIGLLAGILAVLGAETVVWLLQQRLFKLPYSGNPALWILGPLLTTLIILGVGLASTGRITRVAPMEVLRQG